ncbi:hypothetical protein VB618_16845 [Microvirga sp. CF3062]|uniref:hypothetical protein n=1 Tax=Microvirga sp. CF3062 TaxID=3110182 RepID=UPI002E77A16B|nr:hypothetical protein [Microvirga sp. CF3062]MEE1657870.1 hypothetical protein [Microvirga sp. CF3062]
MTSQGTRDFDELGLQGPQVPQYQFGIPVGWMSSLTKRPRELDRRPGANADGTD